MTNILFSFFASSTITGNGQSSIILKEGVIGVNGCIVGEGDECVCCV